MLNKRVEGNNALKIDGFAAKKGAASMNNNRTQRPTIKSKRALTKLETTISRNKTTNNNIVLIKAQTRIRTIEEARKRKRGKRQLIKIARKRTTRTKISSIILKNSIIKRSKKIVQVRSKARIKRNLGLT